MYLDPGFGGMLIQVVVALVAALGAIVFSMRKKIKTFFSKNKDSEVIAPSSHSADNLNDDDVIDTLSEDND